MKRIRKNSTANENTAEVDKFNSKTRKDKLVPISLKMTQNWKEIVQEVNNRTFEKVEKKNPWRLYKILTKNY